MMAAWPWMRTMTISSYPFEMAHVIIRILIHGEATTSRLKAQGQLVEWKLYIHALLP